MTDPAPQTASIPVSALNARKEKLRKAIAEMESYIHKANTESEQALTRLKSEVDELWTRIHAHHGAIEQIDHTLANASIAVTDEIKKEV